MKNAELNKYIENYLLHDKTYSAIMLTGAWGIGKSYYIKNELVPYIDKDNEGKCVIISLYGIKDLKEISKSIYLEIRAKALNKKSEKVVAGKLMAKTVLKGIAGFLGVDLSVSEEKLQELYEAIDLTGKLIILEDLERCSVDIIEVMGFVNNLVEQDGVKVLLVANEKEFLIRDIPSVKEKNEKNLREFVDKFTDKEYSYTKKTEEYLRKKEKTVSDTLVYEQNKDDAIKNIIQSFFKEELLEQLNRREYITEIINVMNTVGSFNLRAVIYACQKTSDIVNLYEKDLDINFLKFMLCSIIAYSCRVKKGEDCKWKSMESSPYELGTASFPLYKVFYDFINNQFLNQLLLEQSEQVYLKQKEQENNESEFNKFFNILRCYYCETEDNVSNAILQIKKLLEKNGVDYGQYGTLVNYLIAVRECVENISDIEECKKFMLNNFRDLDKTAEIEMSILYHSGVEFNEKAKKQEFEEFKNELLSEIGCKKKEVFVFNKSIDNMQNFLTNVNKNSSEYINNGGFAKNLNVEDFVETIKLCSSNLILEIRRAFHSIYLSSNIKEYLSCDKEYLEELKVKLIELKNYDGFDKIQKLQLNRFIGNIDEIIKKLS